MSAFESTNTARAQNILRLSDVVYRNPSWQLDYATLNKRVFQIGQFDRWITIGSQQQRALNLAWAIDTCLPGKSKRIAIIGAGIAGITAAVALAKIRERTVHVFDPNVAVSSIPTNASVAVYPRIHEFPAKGWSASDAHLPIFDWEAGPVGRRVLRWRGQWLQWCDPNSTLRIEQGGTFLGDLSHLKAEVADDPTLEPAGITPSGISRPKIPLTQLLDEYDVVIDASGQHLPSDKALPCAHACTCDEKQLADCGCIATCDECDPAEEDSPRWSYWRNHHARFEENDFWQRTDDGKDWFVISGKGDTAAWDVIQFFCGETATYPFLVGAFNKANPNIPTEVFDESQPAHVRDELLLDWMPPPELLEPFEILVKRNDDAVARDAKRKYRRLILEARNPHDLSPGARYRFDGQDPLMFGVGTAPFNRACLRVVYEVVGKDKRFRTRWGQRSDEVGRRTPLKRHSGEPPRVSPLLAQRADQLALGQRQGRLVLDLSRRKQWTEPFQTKLNPTEDGGFGIPEDLFGYIASKPDSVLALDADEAEPPRT